MRAAIQIIFYASSFAVVLILGNLFDIAFWQARFHAEHLLGNKPLPAISQCFIAHHHLPAHLALLPWFGLVGAPLLTLSATKNYWEPHSFSLRYLAFLSTELLLFIVLLLALALPFIPYYAVLEPLRHSATELAVRLLFWFIATLVVLAAIRRTLQIRNGRNAKSMQSPGSGP
jgi:hypothetical protein